MRSIEHVTGFMDLVQTGATLAPLALPEHDHCCTACLQRAVSPSHSCKPVAAAAPMRVVGALNSHLPSH